MTQPLSWQPERTSPTGEPQQGEPIMRSFTKPARPFAVIVPSEPYAEGQSDPLTLARFATEGEARAWAQRNLGGGADYRIERTGGGS